MNQLLLGSLSLSTLFTLSQGHGHMANPVPRPSPVAGNSTYFEATIYMLKKDYFYIQALLIHQARVGKITDAMDMLRDLP